MGENVTSEDIPNTEESVTKFHLTRVITAFWILGLCNNYTFIVMLSSALDIIHKIESKESGLYGRSYLRSNGDKRNCTQLTPGAILLADILPTLLVKLICPFLPFCVHLRLVMSVLTGILSLILVASSESIIMAIIGVCLASFNSGLGDVTLMAYSTHFVLHAISSWASGTGAAGLTGSVVYAGMAEVVSPETSLYISISIPLLSALSFWVILEHPPGFRNFFASSWPESTGKRTVELVKKSLADKIHFLPKLLPFMIPVGLIYFFEYLINSGLFDKFYFRNTDMPKDNQFRWFNVMYQIGVFVSRSSVTWIHFKKIWVMSLLQGINFIILFLEAIYGFFPNLWLMFIFVFYEGILGGAAYVNTFYNMSYMIDKEHRLFALSIASVADTIGIVFSGSATFPLHSYICNLPFKPVFRWP